MKDIMHSDSVNIELYCNDICIGTAWMLWNVKYKPGRGDYEGEIGRIRLDRSRMKELFYSGHACVKGQQLPLDIVVTKNNSHTIIEKAWLVTMVYAYTADKFVIVSQATFCAENIF